MHSELNSWNSATRTEGLKELISNDYEAVSVSVDISGSCILKVLWSNTNSSLSSFVDYGDTFSLNNNDYNFCVSKKAKYFYIKIENPTNITKLKVVTNFLKNLLKSTSELSAVSATICYGKDSNNNDVPLRLDASGNLKTTGSGGSGGGDASSANQLTQIQKAETTNEKLTAVNLSLDYLKTESHIQTLNQEAINQELDSIDAELVSLNSKIVKCDTDNVIIDSSNPVNTLLLGKVESTLNNAYLTVDSAQNLKVSVSNQNDISSLALESTQQDVKTILQNTFIEINEMKTEILNPTSIQPVTGTIIVDNAFNLESTQQELKTLLTNQSAFNRFQTEAQVTDGKLDTVISNMSSTNFNVNNLTKCNTDSVIIQSGNVSVSGNVTVQNTSLQVTNLTNSTLKVSKANPDVFSLYTGAIASVGYFGSLDFNDYSSCDILVYQPANSVTVGGSLYLAVSDNGIDWYTYTNNSISISTSASDKRYMMNIQSLSTRYISITAESPWGGGMTATTNSIIKVSAKK